MRGGGQCAVAGRPAPQREGLKLLVGRRDREGFGRNRGLLAHVAVLSQILSFVCNLCRVGSFFLVEFIRNDAVSCRADALGGSLLGVFPGFFLLSRLRSSRKEGEAVIPMTAAWGRSLRVTRCKGASGIS